MRRSMRFLATAMAVITVVDLADSMIMVLSVVSMVNIARQTPPQVLKARKNFI